MSEESALRGTRVVKRNLYSLAQLSYMTVSASIERFGIHLIGSAIVFQGELIKEGRPFYTGELFPFTLRGQFVQFPSRSSQVKG